MACVQYLGELVMQHRIDQISQKWGLPTRFGAKGIVVSREDTPVRSNPNALASRAHFKPSYFWAKFTVILNFLAVQNLKELSETFIWTSFLIFLDAFIFVLLPHSVRVLLFFRFPFRSSHARPSNEIPTLRFVANI